ncbi:ABC-type transport auxiliary lipoprotein family protein [Cupriavidus necator]|uniref:ABC-type transport auxiliary lipoprotein family protein n=1 Tax=Cupriavidus necator TaxID=106590 RepID=UPI0027D8056F|nr:ABC-type transport auxiliary lipoprotein family protein [Cupriavidus necator]
MPRFARFARSVSTRLRAALLLGATALALSGCALTRGDPTITYDLGPAVAATSGNGNGNPAPAPLPKLRVAQTDGPNWLEGNALFYRLQYAQAQRLQAYATQRWVMSPTRLFDERLREAVAARGTLAWSGDGSVPALKVDLLEFDQIFDSATTSAGVVRLRATVYRHGMLGQQTFEARRPAPSADGAGGVKALAEASDAVIAALLDWIGTLQLK